MVNVVVYCRVEIKKQSWFILSCNSLFCFDATEKELQLQALKRYEAVCARGEERLVSGSDDFTLFLWQPEKDKKPVGEHWTVVLNEHMYIQGYLGRSHELHFPTLQTFCPM